MGKQPTSRRTFISNSAKATLGVTAAIAAGGSMMQAIASPQYQPSGRLFTGFHQEPLPYPYNGLEKTIDATTMEIHYTKHAAAYAANLQDAAKAEGVDTNQPLENVLAKISMYSAKMKNNGGGHYNHELFWKSMSPTSSGQPGGKFLSALESGFNSFDSFKAQFTDAGKNRFGSGWAWLFIDSDKKLRIGSTPNQDNPLMDISEIKGFPVLGLDVWEHAYYLRYQNKRADYISNWWNVVNWDFVQKRFEASV